MRETKDDADRSSARRRNAMRGFAAPDAMLYLRRRILLDLRRRIVRAAGAVAMTAAGVAATLADGVARPAAGAATTTAAKAASHAGLTTSLAAEDTMRERR